MNNIPKIGDTVQIRQWDDMAAEYGISSGGYILEVHIPKGSHALSIDSISNFSGKEFEVLLNKGSEFLIQEVNHDKHIITVELQNRD